MKTAQDFWIEMHGEPDCDGDTMEIAMMNEYGKYVKEQLEPLSNPEQFGLTTKPCEFTTFPTWEEFNEWAYPKSLSTREIYEFFRNRVQPLERGKEYEFSDDGKDWIRDSFGGYHGAYDNWAYIRPIQPEPKQTVIQRLKKIRDWHSNEFTPPPFAPDEYGSIIADAIKALEGEK